MFSSTFHSKPTKLQKFLPTTDRFTCPAKRSAPRRGQADKENRQILVTLPFKGRPARTRLNLHEMSPSAASIFILNNFSRL